MRIAPDSPGLDAVLRGRDGTDPYRTIVDELIDDDFCRAVALQNHYCDLSLLRLWHELGLHALLARPRPAAELGERLGFVPSADVTLDAMLRRLARRTEVVERVPGPPTRFAARGHAPADATDALARITDDLARVASAMAELGPRWPVALELMDFAVDHFVVALRDDPELMDRILSGRSPEHAELWHRATNADPLQDVHGLLGARMLDVLFEEGTILEIGGGTGNGIRNFLGHLEAYGRLDRIHEYVFTDISNRFLLGTRKDVGRRWPCVPTQWRYLDINEPMAAAKIPMGHIDAIYAVNAAHVAKDIVGFLRGCRAVLRPGGRVVFSERVRWIPDGMAPRELALNLSIYHRTAAERTEARPMHCYLHPAGWRRVLAQAGFANIEVLPDLDGLSARMPEPYAAVVTAVAPGSAKPTR
jgi:SAM-dependent methyltransferase